MTRTLFAVVVLVASFAIFLIPGHYWAIAWQLSTSSFVSPPGVVGSPFQESTKWSTQFVRAAENQIGQTVRYDPAYASLTFPGGDVPRTRGVCTDVIIRALRDAHGIDLQVLVNNDMKRSFGAYPAIWGLGRPDTNIDHRRVPNLRRFFERAGVSLPVTISASDYKPGDVVTWKMPGNRDHIGIVTNRSSRDGQRPLVVHNIGAGTRLQDMLFSFEINGHYRLELSDALVAGGVDAI